MKNTNKVLFNKHDLKVKLFFTSTLSPIINKKKCNKIEAKHMLSYSVMSDSL